MNSLVYLLVKSAKNRLLELLRKPAKLVLWLLVIAGIGGIFLVSLFTKQSTVGSLDLIWLKGILFLLILLFVVIAIQKGLANGDVIFDMNDVNLLFVSPVSPRTILMYGIVRMAKMSFWAGFFILFQSNSLNQGFGVGFNGVLLVLLGFILAVGMLQVLSLLIYSLTNGKPARKRAVRLFAVLAFLPLLVYAGIQLVSTGDLLAALENTLGSSLSAWTPIAGWASTGTVALISGDLGTGFLFLGLLVLSGALLMLYIALSNPDYYEDVLVATETAFEKKRVLAEGQINTEALSTKKVKVAKTGISGLGPSTLFYKHLRESFRANRLGLWRMSSILIVAGAALFSLFIRSQDEGTFILLQILMWMQIFLIGTGRGLKELYMHYIYLIPASSFRKIVWSNLEIAFKVLVESVAVFGIAGLIMGDSVGLIVAAIVVFTLFSFLLLGINYLSLRWTGADISAGFLIFIYTLAVIVIMLPGLIAAFVIGSKIAVNGVLIGLGVLALWELLAALVCFALSKGILHRMDMPVLRTGK
ncbi:putative ABC exporter domain-containing protein [Dehalobacter sp. DCM]|uniref:putative ABC exporter domain-containing protein n=1 Tax=Dehalobacter sp. DCM TaxID=2907827 RepID=UPI003081BB96|nr:putative ABC exporter domain-containing protein [Dehalobacter sp. DCM]